ncbi:MAG: MFS transporter [Flavobacteriales bacterium]|nr:MAG: MFS transporter [Flavobacteriales bacterium]
MVVPFLSLYLTENLGFTLSNVGWIMTAFGLGSVCGAWLGGKLTNRFGFYKVMFCSLFISGLMFIGLQFIHSFVGLCIGVFFLLLVADSFRPALFVAVAAYCKPENRTRSITLIRLAINLGFSLGPAVGGMIIYTMSYAGLFWIDGITCVIAALLFVYVLNERKKGNEIKEQQIGVKGSPYKDKAYLVFLCALLLIGFTFLQYFSTIPLYYSEVHHLSEKEIGWLMSLNGIVIFLIEMPLVAYFENERFSKYRILVISALLLSASFLVLNIAVNFGVLIAGMVFMSFGEMLNFPFLNSFAMDRAEKYNNQGEYMALFTMGFSVSHIFAHNSGMQLINRFGYEVTWYIMGVLLLVSILFFAWLRNIIKNEKD